MSTGISPSSPASQLQVVLPDWCALCWRHAFVCAVYVILFVFYSYMPVSSPATWRAVASGQATRAGDHAFVARVPYAQGMRHAHFGWASDWILARLHAWEGPAVLAIGFAITLTLGLVLWNVVFYLLIRRWFAVAGPLAIAVLNVHELDGLHHGTLGLVCFAILFLMVLSSRRHPTNEFSWSSASRIQWAAMLLLFAVWSNLDVGAVWGVAVLFVFAVERLVSFRYQAHWKDVWADREFQCRVWLLEAAFVSTLLNPLGIGYWSSLLSWPDNAFVRQMQGWSSPTFASWIGVGVLISWSGWVFLRLTCRRPAFLWTALPVCVTVATAAHQLAFAWFVPVMAMSIAALYNSSHHHGIRWLMTNRQVAHPPERMRFAFTLLSILILWVGFCVSPAGVLFGGTPRSISQTLGRTMPHGAEAFLMQQPSQAVVLAPAHWTDYLMANTHCRYCTSYAACGIPASVERDAAEILGGVSGWNSLADKYVLQFIVVDKRQQVALVRAVRRGTTEWNIAYEDETTVVVGRDT